MNNPKYILGTRGSQLALAQAERVAAALREQHGIGVRLEKITTTGDRIGDRAPRDTGDKGLFTKELEQALLDGRIDLAVHSLKDLMTMQPAGLKIGAVCFREDRREALVAKKAAIEGTGLLPLKPGSVIGTGAVRRACQVALINPEVMIRDIRGSVPTRVKKLRDGEYDAIIIAAAGIKRLDLNLSDLHVGYLDPEQFLPAPGQGLLAVQIREDSELDAMVSSLGTERESTEAALERGLLARFQAGCSLPLGVLSGVRGRELRLKAVLGVQSGNGWSHAITADARGTDIAAGIDDAYAQLTESRAV